MGQDSVTAGAAAKLAGAILKWVPVNVTPDWRVYVTQDALAYGKVRLPVSARQAQVVADFCGCLLPTVEITDAIWLASLNKFSPDPIPAADWQREPERAVYTFNADLNGGTVGGGLVATAGKNWVLDPLVVQRPSRGVNYGWHSPKAPFPAADPKAGRVFQPLAAVHDLDHSDYSQTLRLVHPKSVLGGRRVSTAEVYAQRGMPTRYALPVTPQQRDPGDPEGPVLAVAMMGAAAAGFTVGLLLTRQD